MSDIFSKVLAGGLSAALFLFWWPTAVPGSGAEWLLLRGILWALVFEMLMLAFSPLERAVTGAIRARAIRGRLAPRQGARALALALAGLAVPAALIHGAQPQRAAGRAAAAAPAKERVIVKREVVRREVVVKRVNKYVPVTVPAQATTVAAAAAPVRRASTDSPRTRSTGPARDSKLVIEPPGRTTAPVTATPSVGTPAAATSPAAATTPAATSAAPSPAAAPAG
jgi:hypothetical protein